MQALHLHCLKWRLCLTFCCCCSAIALPKTSYPLWDSLPGDVVNLGKLSQLQLEGVLYACTKHQQFLPSGESKYMTPMLVMHAFSAPDQSMQALDSISMAAQVCHMPHR